MRSLLLAGSFASALATTASGQISGRIRIDIPIGHPAPAPVVVVHRPPYREVIVRDYLPSRYGDWRRDYRKWKPVTLYWYDGRYYERPWDGAEVVMVYRAGHDYFLPPHEYAWYRYDNRYDYRYQPRGYGFDDYFGRARPRDDGRYDGRNDRNDGRDNRYDGRDNRNDGRDNRYDGRNDDRRVDPRNDGRRGPVTVDPRRDDGRGNGGRDDNRGGGRDDGRDQGGRGQGQGGRGGGRGGR